MTAILLAWLPVLEGMFQFGDNLQALAHRSVSGGTPGEPNKSAPTPKQKRHKAVMTEPDAFRMPNQPTFIPS